MLTDKEINIVRNSGDREDRRIEDAVDRIYAIARNKGTPGIKSAEIAREQKRRMQRARGDGSNTADGIRRSDALLLRSRGDAATRKRLRNEASETIALRSFEELRRIKRDLKAIDRLIDRSTGKLRRELKNQRRAMKHKYDLAYGKLARIDRSLLIRKDDIPAPADRPIAGDYGEVLAYFAKRRS